MYIALVTPTKFSINLSMLSIYSSFLPSPLSLQYLDHHARFIDLLNDKKIRGQRERVGWTEEKEYSKKGVLG